VTGDKQSVKGNNVQQEKSNNQSSAISDKQEVSDNPLPRVEIIQKVSTNQSSEISDKQEVINNQSSAISNTYTQPSALSQVANPQ